MNINELLKQLTSKKNLALLFLFLLNANCAPAPTNPAYTDTLEDIYSSLLSACLQNSITETKSAGEELDELIELYRFQDEVKEKIREAGVYSNDDYFEMLERLRDTHDTEFPILPPMGDTSIDDKQKAIGICEDYRKRIPSHIKELNQMIDDTREETLNEMQKLPELFPDQKIPESGISTIPYATNIVIYDRKQIHQQLAELRSRTSQSTLQFRNEPFTKPPHLKNFPQNTYRQGHLPQP